MASPRRFLALGDSYTIGEGVAASERWPERLAALLRERGIEMLSPRIVARTGWTTGELEAALDAAPLDGVFDLVTLLIGVNDEFRGMDCAGYAQRFERLLRRAIALAGERAERVIVVSIPDWGVTPFAAGRDARRIGRDIDEYNEANREAARRAGALHVDVTSISRRWSSEPGCLASDGLHPSGPMYAMWADALFPAAERITRQSRHA